MLRPQPSEYQPYFQKYVDLVNGPFFDALQQNTERTLEFFSSIPGDRHNYRYAPGKWTIKDVLMHCLDTERGMSFRALVAARGDAGMHLFSMDEDMYAANVDLTDRSMDSILAEFAAIREASRLLFAETAAERLAGMSLCNGVPTTARAWGYIMVGHIEHHINVVRDRYLI